MNDQTIDGSLASYVSDAVDAAADELVSLSSDIWSHPEIGYQEVRTSALLEDALERRGFIVERGAEGMPTAFLARRGSGSPNVCFMAEYDALPELGHGCGHNLFCCSAVGAAGALAGYLESRGLPGTVTVLGSPAEEGGAVDNGGTKVVFVERGDFDDIDMAMICHADGLNVAERRLNAGATLEVRFQGRSAHAGGSPEKGVNALTAATLLVSNVNACRQQFYPLDRVNCVIRECSPSANSIPELCVVRVNVRAERWDDLKRLLAKVEDCIKAAALVSGCAEEHHPVSHPTADLVPNHALAGAWHSAMAMLGDELSPNDTRGFCWDAGNVSHTVPTLAPYLKIGPDDLVGHTPEFRECANSDLAHKALLDAAKAMAMTAGTFVTDESFRVAVREEFAETFSRG